MAQYQSVPIKVTGGVSSVNNAIELACNSWGQQGFTLNRAVTLNVEVKNGVWENVTFLIFEK